MNVTGSSNVRLIEPTYTMKLVWKTDAGNYLDYFRFDSVVPAEDHSWGAIKSIYKN